MPDVQKESLSQNRLKLTFTLSQEETRPYLEQAAKRISENTSIPGFRPGHADYETVKRQVGEMKIFEEALESMVRASFVKVVLADHLETIGSPKLEIQKLAPGNDIVFTAEVTLMPKVIHLPKLSRFKMETHTPALEEREIDLALKDLQRMQTREVRACSLEAANKTDKVVISLNIKFENVPIQGGQSPNHAIYLNEAYYIPGFKEELIGLKEGDRKVFALPFPKEHANDFLAGKNVEFEIHLKEIYHLQSPTLDDAFAQTLGMQDFATLREMIGKNLLSEKEQDARRKEEKEMLEMIVEKTQFEEIPDLLVNEEIDKMIIELKQVMEEQGVEFDTYLKNLGKTLAQIKLDFTPQAIMRIKVAIMLRAIGVEEKIEVGEQELNEELDRAADAYEDQNTKQQIYSPHHREYMEHVLRNRKVIAYLRKMIVRV